MNTFNYLHWLLNWLLLVYGFMFA